MPVSGDTHGGDMTHSPVVGLLDIWDATHHVFCAVQSQENLFHCLTVCPVFTDLRMQRRRRCSVPDSASFGSSTLRLT